MATTDVTNTLTATITSTEQSTSNVPINRGTGNPSYPANVGVFATYLALTSGTNVINLPISPCYQVYIKNLDLTKTIEVTWTPNSGTNVVVENSLYPGDLIILWQNPTGTAGGITALTLTPSVSGALCEYFLGG
jgi:hypothetical protein